MHFFIALSTVLLTASAMPTQFSNDTDVIADAVLKATRDITFNPIGFASLNGGTQGGAGGAVWPVWDAMKFRDAITGNDPRIIKVYGRIDLTTLVTGTPGVILEVGSRKTIIGGDKNAMIYGGSLRLRDVSQIIIQNIKFHNALSYAAEQPNKNGAIISKCPEELDTIDNISIESTNNVWIDHCEIDNDAWKENNNPEHQRCHDHLINIKGGSNYISISNNIFRNPNMNSLIGNNDSNEAQDIGRSKVTYYFNWFKGVEGNPVRFGEVHFLNNLYTDVSSYSIGVGANAKIYAERNTFINCRHAWGWASGVAAGGGLFNLNNLMILSKPDSGIPGNVGWNPSQYYSYTTLPNIIVEAHVRRFAGSLV